VSAAAPASVKRPNQRWQMAEPHLEASTALAKAAHLPQVLAELLVSRGINEASEAFAFLNPELAHLNDPLLMLGMEAAVTRLEQAIARHEPVLLYGDYDVDGTTAVVLLKTSIEMLGGTVRFHVPHRLREGYGLQSSVLEAAYADGVRLVITVDTGMRAFAEAETARKLGLDLIITDHHLLEAGDAVPHALAILNPNRPGCCYPEKSLCGAAIALKLAQAVLERRDAEHALRSSEQYNRSIVDGSPDCLAILTPDARLSQMTPQGRRLMEVEDFTSIANADWFAFWSGEDQAAARRAVAAALDGSAGRFQGYCPTRAGTPKWWDVIVMPIPGENGATERLLSVARDITEVKNTEGRLTAANRFLDSLIENLPVMVFIKDARTLCYVRQNRACLNLLGLEHGDVIGKRDRDFLPAEQADFILAKDRELLAAGQLMDIPEQSIHTRVLGVRTLHTMKMPILDELGAPEFILGISVDITERKLAESAVRELNAALSAKAAQLEAANKELESFSYSVSHDLRAPLRAIDGFALMLEEDYKERPLDSEGLRYLSVIRQNSRRMGALIDDLLAFSRLGRQPVAQTEVNVDSLVREVVEEVLHAEPPSERGKSAVTPHIEVEPLPPARGDRGLLRQVWANLIANAVKYSSKAARPFIQVSGRQVGAESHYSVRDNGVGFNMEYAEQLFRVFQRLHRADEFSGTGVGLAIVHRVVTRHGGRVWAEGKVDQGAVFSFALPRGD